MKAVISRSDLLKIIGKIQGIVPSKPSVPIVANVLIEAIDDQLIVSATDLSVSMRCYAAAKVIEEGSIALPARRFFQLMREITAPQVKITAQTNEIAEITTGTSLFKINGMNKAEFPQFPDLNSSVKFSMPHTLFRAMLSKTAFAAAREDSRYTLNGVKLHIAASKATFIGTDGKRLAKSFAQIPLDPSITGQYVIPLKAVEEIVKMSDEPELQVSVSLSHDKISIDCGEQTLFAKLLAGQYPDVERVIPINPPHQFSVHREELTSLLRQVSLFTSETSSSVRLSFETGQLHICAMSTEVGEGTVSMPVDYAGPKLDVAFNPYLLIDILRHSQDETVRLGLTDAHNPGLITDSTSSIFVIMPMRLSEVSTPKEAAAVS